MREMADSRQAITDSQLVIGIANCQARSILDGDDCDAGDEMKTSDEKTRR